MKNFIKIFTMISALMIILLFNIVLAADVDVQLNGEIIDFTDEAGNKVNAQIINDRTMVPLRKIFEELGCEIVWNGDTRTVVATKANKQVILQIDNKIASKYENGIEEKIKLDVAPMIVNDRTMVPLRFIAESLGKQVGWDSGAYTAIIIDYDYFSNLLKKENENLYNILTTESNNLSFSVIRNYFDNAAPSNNDSATINGQIIKNQEISNVKINFEGTNELIKEIASEGWNNIEYNLKENGKSLLVNSSNETFSKMLKLNSNTYNSFDNSQLDLEGEFDNDLADAIRSMFNVNDATLKISTFGKMKTDYNRFLKAFITNGTRNLKYDNAKFEVFDYTRFDNIVYGNCFSTNLSFINKAIFNYDIKQDEVLYDWSNINYVMSCEIDNLVLKVTVENEYNEKVSYTVVFKSN